MKDIIVNEKKLEKIVKAFSKDGVEKLHVLADFDRTLTKALYKGEFRPSLISVLRKGNYLCPEYSEKGEAMYDKYHSIEINPEISLEKKKKAMHEWWTEHFRLLVKSRLNIKDLRKVIKSGKITFRKGVLDFFDILHKNNIPLIIMSSTGLGTDAISIYLKDNKRLYDNIHIISNNFEWDDEGYMTGVKEPIIHSMNKDETSVKDSSAFKFIQNRKNVLLLGDSLGDPDMIKGFSCNNLLKIGFLNERVEESLDSYKKIYDIVILNDGKMDYVNNILKEVLKNAT